ncbi:protocadherin Fat 4-like [Chanos chanos]|uniref:Protocadherin Fat 4-like n=1 Tax=Chanos chanos TaxID=29144 RepID=A0A6J2WUQ9_CHACN|nr:protocadherin Fat 4-like [Chanos chanos]
MSMTAKTWQQLAYILIFSCSLVHAQVTYSIPEEMAKGSVVGNIAEDLGLDVKRLKSGEAHIYASESTEYIELNKERGMLLIKEKIDREALCAKTTPCALHLQMILDNPMELYRIAVEITDINDNAPSFKKGDITFEISESAVLGAKFMLEKAFDPDIGINDLHSYTLKPMDHFGLNLQNQADGSKNVEMVLQKNLDREKQHRMSLLLTAIDGGEPQMSGTVQIHITVLDANDNAPIFTQKTYQATLTENAQKGTKITSVSASDADEGPNGKITYSISNAMNGVTDVFIINEASGEVTLNGEVDYEMTNNFQIDIQAKDQGGLSDSCKLIIDVIDINDNKPIISVLSMHKSISEDAQPERVIAMIKVNDPDSGANGEVHCALNENIPFSITSPSNNFISLKIQQELDREKNAEYNITVTCADEGVPQLSSSVSLRLQITDVNDNAPFFEKNYYEAYIAENNAAGQSIFTIKASDADWKQNARVSYILEESTVNGLSLSSYVSVNAESGIITAVRSFDYEQLKDFKFHVKAQDGGSPPLSSNVTVKIIIQDQNDNAPQILYPVQTGGSVVAEMVPRSADLGYLVTKVVAVDVDSGQNAWLSYKLQKSTDRALFEVGAQNGEIRTVRQVSDTDSIKHRLIVTVQDNGQPSRSATVTVNVAVADSFPEVLSEFNSLNHDTKYSDNLTFYLILALAVVSVLFIFSLIAIISVKIYRWRQNRLFYKSAPNLPVIPYYPPVYADGTLQRVYNYEMCGTTDSRMSDIKFVRPYSQNTLVNVSHAGTVQRERKEQADADLSLEVRLTSLNMPVTAETWQQLAYVVIFSFRVVYGQVSYSIAEEMAKGSVVGNIAEDLGFDLLRLKSGDARIYSGDSMEYIELNKERGLLLIKEKIDREALCAKTTPCALHLQMILDNPVELYRITVEITDINDNAPSFQENEITFEISESAVTGAKFMLEKAFDPDVGINGLQSYSLKPTDHFGLKLHDQTDGSKNVEMVLQKSLDREEHGRMSLLLTAIDGGEPQMSGTVQIHITVLDVNDNAPVFNQKTYKATLTENAQKGSKITVVSASDADEGSNGKITYYISKTMGSSRNLFIIDQLSGEVKLNGEIDYEIASNYQIDIQAKDQGGLSDSCKLIIDILDMNDNKPVISVLSMPKSVSEESPPETVIAMINVNDPDSGLNGQVHCIIDDNIPFVITSPSNNFFSLTTQKELDREKNAEYDISVTCADEGVPQLSSSVSLRLQILDVNDNAPVFEKKYYEAHIAENNAAGQSIFTVRASDADWKQNARVSYILEESTVNGVPVSSYVSVNAESGIISAVRSFDYEQLKDFHFCVKAQDGGSPPLSSNVTVKIIIRDKNDNAPQILYPVQTGGSVVAEMVPRSADVGYLVTKVVAVDVDSGQNAWLSYKLQKSTDRALFEVGAQNGEIRTVRQVTETDVVKHRLTVVVEDNGQPSRSATVTINVAVTNSFPEVFSEFNSLNNDVKYSDNLTFYLILALAVVSVLFIFSLIAIISVKIYRWRQNRLFYKSAPNLPVIPYYPPVYADGTLQRVYNYEMCGTTDSRMSDIKFVRPYSQNTLVNVSRAGTVQREKKEQEGTDLSLEIL